MLGQLGRRFGGVRSVSVNEDSIAQEIGHWFFDGYLPTWVAIGNSESDNPESILSYWGVPMHAATVNMNGWLLTREAVLGLLEAIHAPLKAAGYTHTDVIDQNITVYNDSAASVDAIWSRRQADESEIERHAVHYEIHRTDDGWRVIGLASTATTKHSIAEVWRHASGPSTTVG
jgi:hypothetical protein